MFLYASYSKIRIDKHESFAFPIKNGLKQGDALLPLLFDFAVEYSIRRVQENQEGLKFIDTHQLLFYAASGKLFGERIPYLLTYLLHGAESFLRS
jgi:hypothetical protein